MLRIPAFALALLPLQAVAQETPCIPAYQVEPFMEEQGMVHIASPTVVTSVGNAETELWVSPIDGEWIMLVLPPNGTACAVLWGYDWYDGEAM